MKKYTKLTAVLLCLVVIFSAACFNSNISANDDELTIDELRGEINDLNDQLAQLEKWKKEAADEKTAALKDIQGIDAQKVVLQKQIEASTKILEQILRELNILNNDLSVQQAELEAYEELYAQRVRANYEAGQTSYLEVLLSAGSFSDYLTRIDIVEQIMEYDNKLIEDIKGVIADINETIKKVDAKRAEQQKAQDELESQMAKLEEKEIELQNVVAQLTQAEIDYKLQMEAAEEALNEYLKTLDEIIAQSAGGEAPGILSWPVPGHTLITDYWGWRSDPFGGGGSVWHNGIDVGCSTGTPIYAPASGTVIECYWSDSIGNVLIIDHGGGMSTRYYHLSGFEASVGDVVTRGDLVAYVGNTGYYTTGPHLHFEVRMYNPGLGYSESVDPFQYTSPY